MRRLDQRIGQIAKLPFLIGELELGGMQADAAGHLSAHPSMHVVVAKILAGAAEIAAAAGSETDAQEAQPSMPAVQIRPRRRLRIGMDIAGSSVDGDDVGELFPLPVRGRHWFRQVRVRCG